MTDFFTCVAGSFASGIVTLVLAAALQWSRGVTYATVFVAACVGSVAAVEIAKLF